MVSVLDKVLDVRIFVLNFFVIDFLHNNKKSFFCTGTVDELFTCGPLFPSGHNCVNCKTGSQHSGQDTKVCFWSTYREDRVWPLGGRRQSRVLHLPENEASLDLRPQTT